MKHYAKIEIVKADLAVRGVPLRQALPPPWRLLWHFGVAAPPPLFMSFTACAVVMGSGFGVLFGFLNWLAPLAQHHASVREAVFSAIVGGAIFGPALASYFKNLARKRDVPPWSAYRKHHA